ncbi:hypothetical protein, partial [Rhodopirellula bahusiensis]
MKSLRSSTSAGVFAGKYAGNSSFRLIRPVTSSIVYLGAILGVLGLGQVHLSNVSAAGLGVTPAEQFKVPEGFEVELLHEV